MEASKYAIEFKNVSKIYKLKRKDKNASKSKKIQQFYALRDVSFSIEKGRVVGVLGTNGSGKSTMSTLLAGISEPSEGEIIINGEQALVSINTGLNKQLTGLENIELKCALLGFSKSRVKEVVDGVIEFAEIGEFMYQPVKKYSSGMKSRLGFSINLCLDPDIMIIDEALSVGDKSFANKCLKKMDELKEQGKTIVFVSHALPQVRSFCDSAIWLEGGELREFGEIGAVCDKYAEYVEELNQMPVKEKKKEIKRKFDKRVINTKKVSLFDRLFG